MAITKVELDDRSGYSPGSWIRFRGNADSRPTYEEVAEAQAGVRADQLATAIKEIKAELKDAAAKADPIGAFRAKLRG